MANDIAMRVFLDPLSELLRGLDRYRRVTFLVASGCPHESSQSLVSDRRRTASNSAILDGPASRGFSNVDSIRARGRLVESALAKSSERDAQGYLEWEAFRDRAGSLVNRNFLEPHPSTADEFRAQLTGTEEGILLDRLLNESLNQLVEEHLESCPHYRLRNLLIGAASAAPTSGPKAPDEIRSVVPFGDRGNRFSLLPRWITSAARSLFKPDTQALCFNERVDAYREGVPAR